MAEGAGQITDFSKEYRQRAHQTQRIGMTPHSMPRLEEVDEMIKHSDKIHISLQRMREVVFSHHQASMVESPQDARYQRLNGYEHDTQSNYGDDMKAGSFPGSDAKKQRRGVSFPDPLWYQSFLTSHLSEPRRLDAVIAATEPKLLSGVEALMEPGRFAMPVAFVSRPLSYHGWDTDRW